MHYVTKTIPTWSNSARSRVELWWSKQVMLRYLKQSIDLIFVRKVTIYHICWNQSSKVGWNWLKWGTWWPHRSWNMPKYHFFVENDLRSIDRYCYKESTETSKTRISSTTWLWAWWWDSIFWNDTFWNIVHGRIFSISALIFKRLVVEASVKAHSIRFFKARR